MLGSGVEVEEEREKEEEERERGGRGRGNESKVEKKKKEKKTSSSLSIRTRLLLFPPASCALAFPFFPSRLRTMAAGAPAIKAAVQFAKAGTAAKKASVVKEIAIGMSLGMVCGVAFKVCLLSSF